MARIVDQYGFGLVLPDFEPSSLAAALESLTADQVAGWKAASAKNARDLAGEEQAKIWGRIVAEMLAVQS